LDNVYYKDSCKNKIIKVLAPTKGIGDFPQYAGLDDGCYSKVEPSDAEKSSAASIELQTFYNETIVRSSCSPSCEKQGPQEIVDSSACFAVDNSYRDGGMIEKDGRQHNLFTLWRWSCSGRPCDMEDLAVLIPGDDANTHSLSYLIKQTKEMPEKVCRISGGEEK